MGLMDFYNEINNNENDNNVNEEFTSNDNNVNSEFISDYNKVNEDVTSDDVICINSQQAKKALEESSMEDYKGDLNAYEILSFIEQKQDGSYKIRTFLTRICMILFKEESYEFKIIKDKLNRKNKQEKYQYINNSLYIDNVRFDGRKLEIFDSEQSDNDFETDISDLELSGIDFETDTSDSEPVSSEFSNTSNIDTSNDSNYEYTSNYGYSETDIEDEPKPFEPFVYFDSKVFPKNLADAQHYYDNIKHKIISADEENGIYFDSSVNNSICENTDIKIKDGIKFIINFNNEDDVYQDFCMIVNHESKVVVLGVLQKSGSNDEYFLEAYARNIDFQTLHESDVTYNIIWTNKEARCFYKGSLDIEFYTMNYSNSTLCIDFGTSNTTAGIYDNSLERIRTVKFTDLTTSEHKNSNLCPTLVYINKILEVNENGEALEVEYLFGYEAKKVLIDNGYDPNGDMFFEIKRWVVTPNKFEPICDGHRKAKIKRYEIIKAYLLYILQCSENDLKCRFKKFHFSAPVKLKKVFIDFVNDYVFKGEEYSDYQVMSAKDSIDEGVAIVYNHISENIITSYNKKADSKSDIHDDEEKSEQESIMIIDCGGGTTDLASCSYSYRKTDTSYALELETKFENGNSNFGGNNITYRIFQLLKIKLADYYKSEISSDSISVSISKFIEPNQNEVLNSIDSCIKERKVPDIYKELDSESCKSEKIIPTDFNGDSVYAKNAKTRRYVKRNFYYLWQLAEKIKIEFFTRTDLVAISLDGENDVIQIDPENLYFYIKNPTSEMPPLKSTKNIESIAKLPKIEINTNEISALLRPDIYYLLATILSNEKTESYKMIRLAGQSCQINLFQDLLKEFIPGKKIRPGKNNLNQNKSVDSEILKMHCIHGCIAYVKDRDYQIINARIIPVSQRLIYDVRLSRGSKGESSIMEHSLFKGGDFVEDNGILKAKPLYIEQYDAVKSVMKISIYNTVGAYLKENSLNIDIKYECKNSDIITLEEGNDNLKKQLKEYSYNKLDEYIVSDGYGTSKNIIDDLIYRLSSIKVEKNQKKVLVFAVPNSDGYGFVLYQLVKTLNENNVEVYYETYFTNIPFESGMLSKSFFNGRNCIEDEDLRNDTYA